ncbi:MAG TPA: GntG family PLP-dependent aldolase [Myxococcota bacterium]
MRAIDLRSDTVTQPTPVMREEMAKAPVGDDVYGEDPSVNALQERVAALLGKEAALFFPSGTMANQASLRVHTRPGEVVLASRDCHILKYEGGAASALSGLHIQTIGANGRFDERELRAALPPNDPHFAPATLVAIENTHNVSGGTIFPAPELARVAAAARDARLALHLDGARLWNAAVATGRTPAELAAPFDTVSVCLSKGLGAPVGSLVAASQVLVAKLRRVRKQLGGGMRQAGVLAAAGLHALAHHVERLADDHANARRLASGLAALGFETNAPETNIVLFKSADAARYSAEARARGVLVGTRDAHWLRAVTHLDVSASDIDEALARMRDLR